MIKGKAGNNTTHEFLSAMINAHLIVHAIYHVPFCLGCGTDYGAKSDNIRDKSLLHLRR